jgi:hypothetical protein
MPGRFSSIFSNCIIVLYLAGAHAQSEPKPNLLRVPLTSEQASIYSSFLAGWNGGSRAVLNVAQSTEPLVVDDDDRKACLRSFIHAELITPVIHSLSVNDFPKDQVRLVDPKTYQRLDPGDAIRNGEPVDRAVDAGIAAGLYTFSEIAFSASHTRAVFSYSFVCGRLCGSGGIVVYELNLGKWKQSKASCSRWVS